MTTTPEDWGIDTPQRDQYLNWRSWNGDPCTLPESATDIGVTPDLTSFQKAKKRAALDTMFEHPKIRFWLTVDDASVLWESLEWALSFGWTSLEQTPFEHRGFIHLDDFYYRNQCGYACRDWTCRHPDQNDDHCSARTCPLAENADTFEQLSKIGVADDYERWEEEDGVRYVDDSEWLELYKRPRFAMVPNLYVGFNATNKLQWQRNCRAIRILRHHSPYVVTYAIVDRDYGRLSEYPLGEYGDEEEIHYWHPSDTVEFKNGGKSMHVPYLNAIWGA